MAQSMMFDPVRITRLHHLTSDALMALQYLSVPDPAADHVVTCCRHMAHTLNDMWLPMLQELANLASFTQYEGVLTASVVPSYTRHSSRFAPRSAARNYVREKRLERARRAAGTVCDAPWLQRAPHRLTTWTWGQIATTTANIDTAIRRGKDPSSELADLERLLSGIAAEAISEPSPSLLAAGFASQNNPAYLATITTAIVVLDKLLDPQSRARFGTHIFEDNFDLHNGSLGENLATIINFLLAGVDPSEAPPELVLVIANSPELLSLIEPHLELLGDSQLAILAAAVIDVGSGLPTEREFARQRSRGPSPVPLLFEIMSREGGAAAVASSPAAGAALLGKPYPREPGVASRMANALAIGSARVSGTDDLDPLTDLHRRTELLELLSSLVEIHGTTDFDPHVSRQLALIFAPILDDLSPHLDREFLVVTPRWSDPSEFTTVSIGPRSQVASFFGRIMRDEESQLILGVAAGQIVSQTGNDAAHMLITSDREIDAMGYLQATMSEANQLVRFLADSREAENAHLAFEHGLAVARAKSVVNVVAAPLSFGGLHLRPLVSAATPSVISGLGLSLPPEVPSFGLDADLAILFSTTALRVPLDHPELRSRFGVADVPPRVWQQLDALLDDLDNSVLPDERRAAMSRVTTFVHSDPALHSYLAGVRIGSGEL